MAATARQEREMKKKYEKMKYDKSLPPLDQLRAYVLSRGVRSLKSLNRYDFIDVTRASQGEKKNKDECFITFTVNI